MSRPQITRDVLSLLFCQLFTTEALLLVRRLCTHHAELVRQISGLCNNANQLAHRANSTGVAGQQSVDEMTRVAKEVWREIKENY